jgi:hypothetical protein
VVPIRAVMVAMPPVVVDIIMKLAVGRVALEVVANCDDRHSLSRHLKGLHPDLVFIRLRGNEADCVIRSILMRVPAARVIAFSTDGRTVLGCYEFRLHKTGLCDVSPNELIDLIGTAPLASG